MIQAVLAAVAVGTSLYSGYSAKQSSKKQASLMEAQGALQREEAYIDADLILNDGKRFKNEQAMAYISSGVEVQGTPLLLMRETEIESEYEAYRKRKQGDAQMNLANTQAGITRSEGRAQMIASIGNAVGSGVNTYRAAKG
jgi:hypothetical protein